MNDTRPCAIFVATRAFALTNSRLPLMRSLLDAGWRVVAAVPDEPEADGLRREGVQVEMVPFRRGPLALREDLKSFLRLCSIYRQSRPDFVHHFHGKPIILGSLAAQFVPGVRIVNTITGLGYAFLYGGWMKRLFVWGYRLFAARADRTLFQNSDDRDLFLSKGWVPESRTRLITSAGVDTVRFRPPINKIHEKFHVLMASRLVWRKGVREYVEAARTVKKKFPQARFRLAGNWDPAAQDPVPREWIEAAVREGAIEYRGPLREIEKEFSETDLLVQPSYGGEGIPRVLLEAGASAVPVVTTNTAGCREYVGQEETGLLVPPQNAEALSAAILKLAQDAALRQRMGRSARERVLREFDSRIVTQKYLEVYREIGIRKNPFSGVLKPIFIVGAGRTGKKMLSEVLGRHPDVYAFPYEVNFLWRYGHARYPHDQLTPSMLTSGIKKYIVRKFEHALRKSKRKRVVDRTDHNVVRLDYVRAVFDDCRIIHMVRDAKASVASAMKRRTEKRGWRPYLEKALTVPPIDLPYYAACYLWDLASARFQNRTHRNLWGVRTPFLIREEVKRMTLAEQCALQWAESVRVGLDFQKSFSDKNFLLLRYEDMIDRPVETSKQVFNFLELDWPAGLDVWLRQNIPARSLSEWKSVLSEEDQVRISRHVSGLMRQLGYEEGSPALAGVVEGHE